MVLTETLSPNKAVGILGYTWIPQSDVMKVNPPPILIGKKRKGKFTANDKPTITIEDLVNLMVPRISPKTLFSPRLQDFMTPYGWHLYLKNMEKPF